MKKAKLNSAVINAVELSTNQKDSIHNAVNYQLEVIQMDNLSTATNVNGSFIAQVLVGGTGAGGIIDDMAGYRAVSANFGSPTTVTNYRAFLADDLLGAPAANSWGLYSKASFENYMGKSLKIGGVPVTGDKVANASVGLQVTDTAVYPEPITTVARNALTPLEGMLINNSDTAQLERYDGAAWTAVGGFIGTTGSVPFVGAGGTLTEDNANFNWDVLNPAGGSLGIGTIADPYVRLHIKTGNSGDDIRQLLDSPDSHMLFLSGNSAGAHGGGTPGNPLFDFRSTRDLHFTSSSDTGLTGLSSKMMIRGDNGNVGIGTTNPGNLLDVGGKFQVDTNGNVLKINNVATSFPAAQGAASTYLKNDGAGVLTWDDPVFSGTTGSVPFVGAGGTLTEDNSNLFWDDTNNRLGIGTTAPAVPLDVAVDATITTVGTLQSKIGSETTAAGLYIGNESTTKDTYIESAKTFGGGYQSTALKINTIKGGPIYIGQGTPNFTGSLELVNGNFAVTNGGIVMGNSESNITNKSSATAPAGAGAAFYVTKILVGNISFLNKTDGFACNFSCASPTLITGSCVPVGPAVAQCTAPGVNTGIECAYSGVFGTMVCNNWLGHTFAWSALDTGVTQ